MSELLKCPFCGGELELIKRKKGDIYHHPWNECIARAWYFDAHNKRCIKLWNTRTPMQRVLERLEEQKSDEMKYWEEFADFDSFGAVQAYHNAISIIKEEG